MPTPIKALMIVYLFPLKQEDLVPDRFIIYGEHYKEIREAVAKTVLSGSHSELIATLEVRRVDSNLADWLTDLLIRLFEFH